MNAGTWRGRTVAESRKFTVATVTIPSRSQMTTTDASVPPSRRSAYWRTRPDIRRRSESTTAQRSRNLPMDLGERAAGFKFLVARPVRQ
jgi:hypothetical protein